MQEIIQIYAQPHAETHNETICDRFLIDIKDHINICNDFGITINRCGIMLIKNYHKDCITAAQIVEAETLPFVIFRRRYSFMVGDEEPIENERISINQSIQFPS